jgi:hypothetical protein
MITDYLENAEKWYKEDLKNKVTPIQYLTGQMEVCPSTKKLHFQGYIELNKAVDLTTLKSTILHPGVHLEQRRGSQAQAIDYVTKTETRAPGCVPFKWGELKAQGKRTDLSLALTMLRNKESVVKVIDEQPSLLPYINALTKYQYLLHENITRTEAPEVTVIIGEPGTGKTRHAYDNEPDLYRVCEPTSTVFFDGYKGQEAVLFDDFKGNIRYHYFLQLLDRYKMNVNVKGGQTNWCPKRIYITSNFDPQTWYQTDITALRRRISKYVYKSTEVAGNTSRPHEND